MNKHAYLIMAHDDAEQLSQLVSQLDDERNDIYIHLDKKTDISKFEEIKTKKANIEFIGERIDVHWGDISLIFAEYSLFRAADCKHYSRIHLMSGADYPLKSQDYIHHFFLNDNKEYIGFEDEIEVSREIYKKMRLYNFFLSKVTHPNKFIAFFANYLRRGLMVLQILLGVKRTYSLDYLRKGSNWVSITPLFLKELIKYEKEIKEQYRFTHCCDEIYKQTIAWNGDFRKKISPLGNLRLIDFERGNGRNPYTFRLCDIDILRKSNALFARKFSTSKSAELILKLNEAINKVDKDSIDSN